MTVGEETELKRAIIATGNVAQRRQASRGLVGGSRWQGVGYAVDGRRGVGGGVKNELYTLYRKM